MLVSVIRPVPQTAVDFVKRQEGRRLHAYPDSGGVPTIGDGHTGPEVHLGMVIDDDQADIYLAQDLAKAARELEAKIGEACVAELTENQYSALLSFVFNLGTGDPKKPEWAIWGLLRAQQFDQACAQLSRFVYAGGKKLQDLVQRRADEQVLWATGEPGTMPGGLPSSVTRAVDTPPADPVVKPLTKSKSMIGSCVAACLASASAIAPQIKDGADGAAKAIAPYVGQSEVLHAISSHLALVAAAAALAVPFLLWIKNREAKAQ